MNGALDGRRIAHYAIERLLGRGAMGEVYLARDTRLDCLRALKFLHWPTGADAGERELLLAEARAAAALNHPGLCAVHEVGEAEGRLFIVMEYVSGEDLSERIARGPLPVDEALRIARALAESLRAAHAAGVVHRDIKPRNIRITPTGDVKLMDFGLALLPGQSGPLRSGELAGTPATMAPEQARGEAADARSDLWALGAVLHEMLSGEPPFAGTHELATLYAVCNEAPRPLPPLPDAPAGLPALLRRLLAKDPEQRPADADALVAELDALAAAPPDRRGGPAALLRRLPAAVIAVVALSLPLGWWRSCLPDGRDRVLALLPLEVIGGDGEDQILAAGLAQHLTARLMNIERFERRLAVVPACDVDDSDISSSRDARRLFGANLVVAGSLGLDEESIAVTLNLIDPTKPRLLGAAQFTVPRDEALLLRSESLAELCRLLEIPLAATEPGGPRAGDQPTQAAFSDYLAGLGFMADLERFTWPERVARVDSALARFGLALAAEPRYADARAGWARAAWARCELTGEEAWSERALGACEQALAIAPDHAEGLLARGRIRAGRGEYERALVDFRTVLVGDSLSVAARRELADCYEALGDTARAAGAYREALTLRPMDFVTLKELGIFRFHQGHYGEAIAAFERLLAATPENTWLGYNQLGGIYYQMDDLDRAEAAYRTSLDIAPNYRALANLGTVLHARGDYEAAVALRREALALHDCDYRVWGALAASLIRIEGRRDEALAAYRRAAELAEERWRVNPRDARVLSHLAGYYEVLDDDARALSLLDDARATGPLDLESLYQIGHTLEKLGRRTEALDCLGEALERGYAVEKIERAPTLTALRADPRWRALRVEGGVH